MLQRQTTQCCTALVVVCFRFFLSRRHRSVRCWAKLSRLPWSGTWNQWPLPKPWREQVRKKLAKQRIGALHAACVIWFTNVGVSSDGQFFPTTAYSTETVVHKHSWRPCLRPCWWCRPFSCWPQCSNTFPNCLWVPSSWLPFWNWSNCTKRCFSGTWNVVISWCFPVWCCDHGVFGGRSRIGGWYFSAIIVGQVSNDQTKDLGDAHGCHAVNSAVGVWNHWHCGTSRIESKPRHSCHKQHLVEWPHVGCVTGTRIAIVKVFQDLSFASAATFREVITETVQVADPNVIVIDASQINDVCECGRLI